MKILLLSGIKNIHYLENYIIKIIHLRINWKYTEKKKTIKKLKNLQVNWSKKEIQKIYLSILIENFLVSKMLYFVKSCESKFLYFKL